MTIEHIGGIDGLAHVEIWGKSYEIPMLENDDLSIDEFINSDSDILFFHSMSLNYIILIKLINNLKLCLKTNKIT